MSIKNKIRECNGCKFCCWSFHVNGFADNSMKLSLSHCSYECKKGCSIHGGEEYPYVCGGFICPYLTGENIHRPDTFQKVLEEAKGNIGNYIPTIPVNFDSAEVRKLIKKSRSVPASIIINDRWHHVILPLDRNENGNWVSTEEIVSVWEEFYNENSTEFDSKNLMNVMIV